MLLFMYMYLEVLDIIDVFFIKNVWNVFKTNE